MHSTYNHMYSNWYKNLPPPHEANIMHTDKVEGELNWTRLGANLTIDGFLTTHSKLGEITQDKTMSRCHLPRVVYHQVYNVY